VELDDKRRPLATPQPFDHFTPGPRPPNADESEDRFEDDKWWSRRRRVGNPAVGVPYVLVMVAVIVGVDLLFFSDHPWQRPASNVGIVLLFGAFYFRFFVNS
jgi:hypothetical protein